MSMESIIKEKTEEMVLKYKLGMKAKGGDFNPLLEDIFRQGISFGISIASIALASTPVDITFPKANVENKLPSKNEYTESLGSERKHTLSSNEWSEPKFKCPRCDGYMRQNTMMILPSNPPKYKYKCDTCGSIEYL